MSFDLSSFLSFSRPKLHGKSVRQVSALRQGEWVTGPSPQQSWLGNKSFCAVWENGLWQTNLEPIRAEIRQPSFVFIPAGAVWHTHLREPYAS